MLLSVEGFGDLLSQTREVGAVLCHRLLDLPQDDPRAVPLLGGPYEATVKSLVRQAVNGLPQHGITTMRVHGVDREALALLDELNAEAELPVRLQTFAGVHPSDKNESFESAFITGRVGKASDRVRCVGARFWLDGRIESETAYVKYPYPGTSDKYGSLTWKKEEFKTALSTAARLGLAVSTRCVGDAAIDVALNAYSAAFKNVSFGDNQKRWWRQIDVEKKKHIITLITTYFCLFAYI